MKKGLLFFIAVLLGFVALAQEHQLRSVQAGQRQSSTGGLEDNQKTETQQQLPATAYKIISVAGDTTHVDTTLTIYKAYRFNYLRRDNFGLLPFANVGQPYTSLTYDFDSPVTLPQFGARAAHFAYLQVDDIHYYHVPTPWSQLFFKTTFEQGQLLDAFLTSNINPQLNVFIAYKGLHSMGKYRHATTSQNSFRIGFSYRTKNNRYGVKSHFISQNLSAFQNGGLTPLADQHFKSEDDQYNDRSVLDVKYENADRLLLAKRFFVKQHYKIFKGNDTTGNNQLRIGHIFNFTDKEWQFKQKEAFPIYGEAYRSNSLRDLTEFQRISNTLFLQFQNRIAGNLLFKVRHSNYNYGYQRKLYLDHETIPNRLKGDVFSVGAAYQKNIGGFHLTGDAMLNVAGDFNGNYLKAEAGYALDSLNKINIGLHINSRLPNYNFLLFQSDYKNLNWYNHFDNQRMQSVYFQLISNKLLEVKASYTRIHNYAYFGLKAGAATGLPADSLVRPYQYDGDVNYLKIKAHRQFNFWRFSLDNTLLYQKVLSGESVFRTPDFITRNTLYYRDYWFDNNLYLQTGFTFNYFTSFKANAYHPVLGEFYVQDFRTLSGFYRLDFFFNAQVRNTRLYFKLENLSTLIDGNGHYAAPYRPYRDFVIRFGLVWDFFW